MKKFFVIVAFLLACFGICTAQTFAVNATNNNFTMLDTTGGITGGANDVNFTWDGTMKAAVAASGQVSNATISSTCPFFGVTWNAHDVAIYGPGTYTVYTGCPAGSPGCGSGAPVTFTVGLGEIGAHMLFDWGGNNNLDVVNVLQPNAVFAPSPLYTGGCGSNSASTVWGWMSKDVNGDGINGYPMVDGPFVGFNANFNLIGGTNICSGVTCDDHNQCTADACDPATGNCVFTPISCNDNNPCTDDTCDPAVGCVYTLNNSCNGSSRNNFTMLDTAGGITGGTNDVSFTWDGTMKTSVAVSGQVSNATLSSTCPFFGLTWNAHDTAIYGPGTYTVYSGCPAGSPGCGAGAPITFTVGLGEIGGHVLFDWGATTNVDVVNVFAPNAVFAPSPLYTGACGSNSATTVWGWMSKDVNGDGINGYPMVDGPFLGFNANFNLMTSLCTSSCDDGNACTIDMYGANCACVHTAINCNDNNICTTDTCDTATGACIHTPIPDVGPAGQPCDDGNPCTTNDVCRSGICSGTPINCNDNNACTIDSCVNNGCMHTAISCDDGNTCTTDSCDPAIGCVHTAIPNCGTGGINTVNNNLTMIDATGGLTGGTNDVHFTWDGTQKTSVALSGQASNATLSSTCPFFGVTWSAHDVAIYGPGTYTVYSGCAAGNPGCGTGTPITFTVAAGEMGGHMLFNWGGSADLDVVNVWTQNAAFGPSPLYTGTCGSNPATKVWNLMSKDWNGDGINGYPMVDGPFIGFNANFNLMTSITNLCANVVCPTVMVCNSPLVCDPATGQCLPENPSCNDGNACTSDSCNVATGQCVHTLVNCDDNNACTTDTCDPATGCVHTAIPNCGPIGINTVNNNLTMIDATGGLTGGTNDVHFTWDGTQKTSVAASGQVFNATLSSACPFFGVNWSAHDVAIYGPGTYSVYVGCPAGSPGCGTGVPITFTVASGEIGGHMLFNWGGNNNMDVVNVWTPKAVFGPSPLWTGACGSNPANKVWDWMSKDFDGDGINGTGMLDGPFVGFNANFNLMGMVDLCAGKVCNDNNACTTDACDPATGNCVFTTIVCNDNNLCTADTCNPVTGCVFSPISCDDSNACTTDTCVASTGCVHTAKVCNDNNVCTTDSCNAATGVCVYTPVANGTICTTTVNTPGTCQSGTCVTSVCPRGSYKSVTLKGTGSSSWWIESQIMTKFTVAGSGCILRYTASSITATPGTVLKADWKVGIGPNPTSVTWKGVAVPASTVPYAITCPSSTGTVGSLVLRNTSARGGKDTDNLTVSTATN